MKSIIKKRNQRHRYSPTFKIGAIWIIVFAAIGVAGSVALFTFGLAWVFMGVYNHDVNQKSHITLGVIMMCLAGYLIMMNVFSLIIDALALNHKSARRMMFIAVISILAIVPMIGGIIMLFTPIDLDATNAANNKLDKPDREPEMVRTESDITILKEEQTIDEDLNEKETMANKLRTLKLRLDQGIASDDDKDEFEWLLAEYRSRFPKASS